eukprot:5007471-Amphidinium_carterae.2
MSSEGLMQAVLEGYLAEHPMPVTQDFNTSMTSTLSLGEFRGGGLILADGKEKELNSWRCWHLFDGQIS